MVDALNAGTCVTLTPSIHVVPATQLATNGYSIWRLDMPSPPRPARYTRAFELRKERQERADSAAEHPLHCDKLVPKKLVDKYLAGYQRTDGGGTEAGLIYVFCAYERNDTPANLIVKFTCDDQSIMDWDSLKNRGEGQDHPWARTRCHPVRKLRPQSQRHHRVQSQQNTVQRGDRRVE
jgi:hypothetical protein